MKTSTSSLALGCLLLAALSNALTFPVRRVRSPSYERKFRKRSGSTAFSRPTLLAASSSTTGSEISMDDTHDILYMTNITVGGQDYLVQLDTGSSDLWIKGPSSPLPNSQTTSTTWNLTYGIGWAYGTVNYAPVQFAGISVSSQAYLDVSAAVNPALQYGATGIAGLGFDSLSTVDALVNHTGSSTGRSLLHNLFADNTNEPNFISFALQRTADNNNDVQGTFSIGEVSPQYASVLNNDPLPTFPEAYPSRWNVLVDALIVGSKTVPVSTVVTGAPAGKAVVLLDSGTSFTYAPEAVCTAIYGAVPGASYDSSIGQWIVPCDVEIDIALQFGGKVFPIHPLDVSPQSLSVPGQCTGTFIPQTVAVGAGEFDWLVGDNVLRSIYSVYDFGDYQSDGSLGNPYVKLLSLVDPNKASAEFHQLRGGAAATNITYNAANSTTSSSPETSSASGSLTVSGDAADTINKLAVYLPAMLAIMALNALVILLLVVAAFVYMFRRRGAGGGKTRTRKIPGRMTPMPMNPTSTASSASSVLMPGSSEPAYQPVSMALTEDTLFVPPSPAFSKDGTKIRPMSVA
ncbi:aspartic peptidase domain-containing protein [Cytidiella melzeri]|nr:aspartic peptidase domain-containing protein [Cytidiella melzeri]